MEQAEQGKNEGNRAKQGTDGGNRAEHATNVGNRQSREQIDGIDRAGKKYREQIVQRKNRGNI
jgi:hypothetical protein